MAWCRRKLQTTIDNSPKPRRFDSELSIGNVGWDCFAAECGILLLRVRPDDTLARRLAGSGLVAFNCNTMALTMLRAAMARNQLGASFPQMVAMSVQWAALRPLQVRHDETSLVEERESFLARKHALLEGFVSGSSPLAIPNLAEMNAEAQAACEAISEKRFPGSSARQRRHRGGISGRAQSRKVLYQERLGVDPYVMKAAFGWLDLRFAQTADERLAWLGFIREILGIVLHSLPTVSVPSTEEIDGLPSDFDDWALKLVAQTIPRLTATETPEVLWQPILNLGAPAHQWVERFFWHWFTDGLAASSSTV